jgi:hypothetical protein
VAKLGLIAGPYFRSRLDKCVAEGFLRGTVYKEGPQVVRGCVFISVGFLRVQGEMEAYCALRGTPDVTEKNADGFIILRHLYENLCGMMLTRPPLLRLGN